MILKKILIVTLALLSLFPSYKIYAQSTSGGFVPGSIWYSKDPFEEGDKVKVYTFLFNPDSRELSGTLVFFDKEIILGKRDFVLPGKTADDFSIEWTVTIGSHSIYAKIENAQYLVSKGKYTPANLAVTETTRDLRTVNKKGTPQIKTINDNIDSLENLPKLIEDNTPRFIARPIIAVITASENFRFRAALAVDTKKTEVKAELQAASEAEKAGQRVKALLKVFRYVELFALSLVSFLLNYKIVFYGLIVLIIFLILRYLWLRYF